MIDIQKETLWPTSSTNSSVSTASSSSSSMEISDERSIPPELLQSLRQHSLFQRTNNESFLEKLACCMHLRTYGPRDIIIVEGEPAKAMFFLLRGSVDVCSADFERIYATLPKGSCFGEIGILYSMPRTATVIASTKCIVAALTADEVKTILPLYPEVEKMLRFEAEERLTMLNKSKNLSEADKVSYKPLTERNIEDLTSARNLLQKIPYFQNCPEEFLHLISLKVEPRHYSPNDLILRRGDQGKELFFIMSGTVEVANMDTATSDPLSPIARLSAGDYFGDIAVLLNAPRAADARAVTAIELYVLNKCDFIDVISRFPDLQKHFKMMAESSLNDLRLKASLLTKVDAEAATPAIPPESPTDTPSDEVSSTLANAATPITLDSVCSTTSDQDPTLLPPTTANVLKTTETRRRRASIAIWSDPNLVALANRNIKEPAKESKLKETIEQHQDTVMKPPEYAGDGKFELFNQDVLSRIINYLDFSSIIQFSAVSKKCREFVQKGDTVMQHIDLSHLNKRITDNALDQIMSLIGDGARIKELNLSQCFYITDDGFQRLMDQLPNVESLDLNSCWLLTDKSLALLAVNCPRLTRLDLSNCRKISDIGIFKMLDEKQTRGFLGLKELSLSYCKKLSDMTMSHLAEFCSNTLESLNIQRCTRISDQGFVKWADTQFPSLKYLNLTDCSFLTDQAISHLVSAAPRLESLSLSFCCALSDNAIEGLISLPHLQELDASFCGAAVSDVSIRALMKSSSSESMNSLNLRGCVRITDTGVKSILELGHLNTLNISQCPGISLNAKQIIKESGNVHNLVA
ncbi:hypothetical protein HMPREF1544_11403 [Mucor circinelloides 1006PhL]|uniref:Cyclic nucleotide-binding domain-containing protein n=1 Tax=Mucor circinelloides f. circinelloides (strain 1006PhL) TaxID=1220926 RepID=S2IX48_MUCC1|nr:hypothetical protein HMPREF1544_11403 [Mucor circinelloides 1006PhL]